MMKIIKEEKENGVILRELTRRSASGEEGLFSRCWLPEGDARAVIQIAHGMNEHSLRYDHFARALVQNGFAVFANDHIGHGRSEMGHPRTFSMKKGGFEFLLADMHSLYEYAIGLYPGLPVALFGHSMGSIAAGLYPARYDEPEALTLCGTPSHNPIAPVGICVARLNELFRGRTAKSRFLLKQSEKGMGDGEKDPYKAAAWLSRDEGSNRRFVDDPLCGGEFSASAFGDLLGALNEFGSHRWSKRLKDIPTLITAGTADTCGGCGRAPMYYYQSLIENHHTDVTLKLWENCRHELLNELNSDEIEQYIIGFFREKLELN